MAIKKQEFYEGAALYHLARSGRITSIRYDTPIFLLNDTLAIHLKYSTKSRSPWGFTFVPEEQALLERRAGTIRTVIGLICGADGVVALDFSDYRSVASARGSTVHIACYRHHREYYEVNGPDGTLDRKVAPSDWQRILDREA